MKMQGRTWVIENWKSRKPEQLKEVMIFYQKLKEILVLKTNLKN